MPTQSDSKKRISISLLVIHLFTRAQLILRNLRRRLRGQCPASTLLVRASSSRPPLRLHGLRLSQRKQLTSHSRPISHETQEFRSTLIRITNLHRRYRLIPTQHITQLLSNFPLADQRVVQTVSLLSAVKTQHCPPKAATVVKAIHQQHIQYMPCLWIRPRRCACFPNRCPV
jgi:hypothetical protein